MIDFHSHILPGIDDGARNIDTSLEMLRICKDTGIECVVATPHCHPIAQEKIYTFLERRKAALKRLDDAILATGEEFPRIVTASEVRIYNGISKYKDLDLLCVAGTEYILLEMPYEKWKDDTFEEIYQITRLGLKPIIAHLDRFFNQEHLFPELYSLDLVYQINSSAFLNRGMRRRLPGLFEANAIHVIGSDTHNLKDRYPNAATAYGIIEKKFGEEYALFIKNNARLVLENKDVGYSNLSKLGTIKKLLL